MPLFGHDINYSSFRLGADETVSAAGKTLWLVWRSLRLCAPQASSILGFPGSRHCPVRFGGNGTVWAAGNVPAGFSGASDLVRTKWSGLTDTLKSMCGRYASSASPQDLMEEFEVDDLFDGLPGPDYNVAPTVAVPAVFERRVKDTGEVRRRLAPLVWGLVPSWAKEASMSLRRKW